MSSIVTPISSLGTLSSDIITYPNNTDTVINFTTYVLNPSLLDYQTQSIQNRSNLSTLYNSTNSYNSLKFSVGTFNTAGTNGITINDPTIFSSQSIIYTFGLGASNKTRVVFMQILGSVTGINLVEVPNIRAIKIMAATYTSEAQAVVDTDFNTISQTTYASPGITIDAKTSKYLYLNHFLSVANNVVIVRYRLQFEFYSPTTTVGIKYNFTGNNVTYNSS